MGTVGGRAAASKRRFYVVRNLCCWIRNHGRRARLRRAPPACAHAMDCCGRRCDDRHRDSVRCKSHAPERFLQLMRVSEPASPLPRRRPPGNRPQSLKAPASAQLGSLRPGAPSFAGAPHLTRHKSGCLSSGIPTDRSSSVGRRSGFSDLGNHEPRPSVSHFQTSRLSQIAISPCRK
jgi:hypothetical protein